MKKQRLDLLLVARGLFPSRAQAQRAIMAGDVLLTNRLADKPGLLLPPDAPISVRQKSRYVSRGGLKLEAALSHFAISAADKVCLDIGASTGGFTDCLLQHGASRVYAFDVGHSQLDWKIRSDPRVIAREKCNARYLRRADIPEPVSLVVIDVSFISLRLILPVVFELLAPGASVVALIKPQFELSKAEVDPGRGVVRDPQMQQQAVEGLEAFAKETGWQWLGVIESPILGGEGNREFLAHLRRV